jgi:hypothetical protein
MANFRMPEDHCAYFLSITLDGAMISQVTSHNNLHPLSANGHSTMETRGVWNTGLVLVTRKKSYFLHLL